MRTNQIQNEVIEPVEGAAPTGTVVTFAGLRGADYQSRFPSQPAVIVRHFGSHFLAEFILGKSPTVRLTIGDHEVDFPQDINKMLIEERGKSDLTTDAFGDLTIAHFIFRAAVSAGFDGNHQLHLVANGWTVTTRKIDGLLSVGRFGPDGNAVYHGCVSGNFLDERVNQERTHFNFDEAVTDEIAKTCTDDTGEVATYDEDRLHTMVDFVKEYPSFDFAAPEDLLRATPKNATKPEQFAQALIATRIRRDFDRKQRVQEVVSGIGEGHDVSGDFAERVRLATNDIRAESKGN